MTETNDAAGADDARPVRAVPPLMSATWETATSDPDPLTALGATRALAGLLSTWESKLVAEAVAAGVTWERIGGTVGVSRQAAWQRYHEEIHDLRRRLKEEAHAIRERHRHEVAEFHDQVRREMRGRRRRG
jgi:hypothetical protein